jgi:hypothetical protein
MKAGKGHPDPVLTSSTVEDDPAVKLECDRYTVV